MTPLYSIQIDGQKEELFEDMDSFNARAHTVICLSKPNKPFIIRDYVMSDVYPTQVVFERLESGEFDIKINQ